jgi:hypothetical protein
MTSESLPPAKQAIRNPIIAAICIKPTFSVVKRYGGAMRRDDILKLNARKWLERA